MEHNQFSGCYGYKYSIKFFSRLHRRRRVSAQEQLSTHFCPCFARELQFISRRLPLFHQLPLPEQSPHFQEVKSQETTFGEAGRLVNERVVLITCLLANRLQADASPGLKLILLLPEREQ